MTKPPTTERAAFLRLRQAPGSAPKRMIAIEAADLLLDRSPLIATVGQTLEVP